MAWLLLAASASAGLGQISVRSHIGEPFNAVVSLNDVSSLSQVRVGLADRATFDDLNVDYEPALAGLRFSLVSGATGPKVLIRSQAPIRSSYLRFVLELKNPPERSVREYTVLLDSFEGDEVKAPQSSAVPRAAKTPAAPAAPAARMSSVRVPPGGTLAGVARQVKPAGVSLQQTMASLYLANPDKFTDRDPLHIQGGARLSVPSAASMRALSPARVRDALRPRNVAASAAHGRSKVVPAEPLPPSVLRKMIKPSEPLHAPVAAQQTPAHGDAAAAPVHSASAPVAVDASAAAAEAAKVKDLQQQVDARAQDLKKANKHIEDLKLKIKALEASQAHAAEAAKGFWHGKGLVKWGAAAAGALALLLILALVWRRRRAGGKARPSNPHPLATTGVAPAAPEAAAQGDGDPLAEAEVYLSYGHDEQAEAILVKGLEQNPSRQDIRAKLLEIYAARPDPMRYERLAREVHDAYDGRGAQWERTRAMGQTIDPDNPLYQPEDATAGTAPAATEPQAAPADASALDDMLNFDMGESVVAEPEAEPVQSEADKDALLNFDFSLDGAASATTAQPQAEAEPESQEEADALAAWEAALGEAEAEAQPAAEPAPAAQPEAEMLAAVDADDVAGMDQSAPVAEPEADLAFPAAETAAVATEPAAAEVVSAVVDDLPLEVDPMADAPAPEDLHVEMIEHDDPADAIDDALATKLDLARVYLDMGDNEGAREVLLELQKEAQGPLRQQADEMLAKLL